MKDQLGVKETKKKMTKMLSDANDRTWPAPIDQVMNLVVDTNVIRSKGNAVAHVVSPDDISEAIGSLPLGADREVSQCLFDLLYSEEDE